MRNKFFGGGGERDHGDAHGREWARLQEDDTEFQQSGRYRGRARGRFEEEYGSASGSQGYGGRDYGHTGAFTGSASDFGEPSGRHDSRFGDFGSGDRGWASRERNRMSGGAADDYGQRNLAGGGRNDAEPLARGRSRASAFEEENASFGMNLQGNFGFDRGGEGAAGSSYFSGSDRGKPTTATYAARGAHTGGDNDRGFAGRASEGGTDRDYSGGLNYGFGGGAYRSGAAHDRFSEVPAEMRSREQLMRNYRGVGPTIRRSDERLREIISERLEDDDMIDASDIEVSVEGAVVRLSGAVPDRAMKRRAADLAERISGVQDVENSIRVMRS